MPMPNQQGDALLLHLPDAAEKLGLSAYQTRNLVKAGTLPSQRLGNRTYVPVAAIEEYVAKIAAAS
jgi:excisionase family DNA binding protein